MQSPLRQLRRVRSWITLTIGVLIVTIYGSNVYAANPWALEAGEATTNNTGSNPTFANISFITPFSTTPIVVVLPTDEGVDPASLQIRNITTTGFEVAPVEPTGSDGPHTSMTFHYVAITPGIHTLPTGETVIAGTHTTSSVQQGLNLVGPTAFDTVNFGATLSASAAVIASIQTTNSETGAVPGGVSVPWLVVTMRNPTASSVEMALERAEAGAGTVLAETIGYIAFVQGTSGTFFDDNDIPTNWSAVVTPDNIVGFSNNNCVANSYATTAFATPRVIATQLSRDGSNGGWLRRCSLSGTTIGLVVDEDTANDDERNHTTELAGVLAFSRSFHAVFQGLLTATKTVQTEEDPVNGTSGAFAIPGARVRYFVDVESIGRLPIDNDTISFVDALPPETSLVVTDIAGVGSGPVVFTDGSTASTLSYTFTSLASTTDDIAFSNNNAASFTYTPVPGTDGIDPAVTHIRIEPEGAFAGDAAAPPPSFQLQYDVIIN